MTLIAVKGLSCYEGIKLVALLAAAVVGEVLDIIIFSILTILNLDDSRRAVFGLPLPMLRVNRDISTSVKMNQVGLIFSVDLWQLLIPQSDIRFTSYDAEGSTGFHASRGPWLSCGPRRAPRAVDRLWSAE